jgi:plasmid stability protein
MLTFMTTFIQIRSVPQDFHRRLKARAAMEGVSMSEYILREVGKSLEKPIRAEVLARIRAQPTLELKDGVVDVIHADREERDAQLDRS